MTKPRMTVICVWHYGLNLEEKYLITYKLSIRNNFIVRPKVLRASCTLTSTSRLILRQMQDTWFVREQRRRKFYKAMQMKKENCRERYGVLGGTQERSGGVQRARRRGCSEEGGGSHSGRNRWERREGEYWSCWHRRGHSGSALSIPPSTSNVDDDRRSKHPIEERHVEKVAKIFKILNCLRGKKKGASILCIFPSLNCFGLKLEMDRPWSQCQGRRFPQPDGQRRSGNTVNFPSRAAVSSSSSLLRVACERRLDRSVRSSQPSCQQPPTCLLVSSKVPAFPKAPHWQHRSWLLTVLVSTASLYSPFWTFCPLDSVIPSVQSKSDSFHGH